MEDFEPEYIPLLEVVVVSGLPRGALVEWQVVACLPAAQEGKSIDQWCPTVPVTCNNLTSHCLGHSQKKVLPW
jgi:hypothetical protein